MCDLINLAKYHKLSKVRSNISDTGNLGQLSVCNFSQDFSALVEGKVNDH